MKKLQVKSVKSLGMMPVFDLTMPTNHNFILENGIVAHNCSYAYIGYACQYLKTKYPLAWWTAVLRNASKTELPKFWPHCGSFILLPDINLSKEGWTIEGDKIRAPINILNGVGDVAYNIILKSKPYTSLEHFVKVTKAAGVAVNKGVVCKLIASGVMDSLFPADMGLEDKIYQYMLIKAQVEGKKKIEPVPEEYQNLHSFQQFLVKKQVIPVISMDFRDSPYVRNKPPVDKRNGTWFVDGEVIIDGDQMDEVAKYIIANPKSEYSTLSNLCTISYVIDEGTKLYANKSKQMTRLTLDTGGTFHESVLWPHGDSMTSKTGFKNSVCRVYWRLSKKDGKLGIKSIEKLN